MAVRIGINGFGRIGRLTLRTILDEVRPGLGGLDYRTFLRELNQLDPEMPLLIEHLAAEDEYTQAAEFLRSVEREI